MPLLLPRHVVEERERIDADRRAQVFEDYSKHWTQELRRIDPSLRVVRASESAWDPDLEPGAWYLEKEIPGSVNEYMPLPRPPGGWLYDWLTAADMWNPRVHRSKQEARDKLRAAKVRARKHEAEQRQDAMAEALSAARRLRSDAGMTRRTDLKRKG